MEKVWLGGQNSIAALKPAACILRLGAGLFPPFD
jgi:hypothetical protein